MNIHDERTFRVYLSNMSQSRNLFEQMLLDMTNPDVDLSPEVWQECRETMSHCAGNMKHDASAMESMLASLNRSQTTQPPLV